ncbi:bifunctional folylpolyglutamate synthase/dihydrofolate synthase [Limosilactobacillus caecicola]|uniref:bifunctional folylpolyglutamate synthase/dihydrofolate synthase n=1 Tax=Limosilactobacillus caecicola TaxID=2941332 RepID=UPI00203B9D14|nr:folylpolyglutamate synthase/dihydrofolate synthase family protein [Limosilactobacillus caecicola]
MQIKNYEDALKFIHGRPRFKKRPTLERMKLFLRRLGNPEKGQQFIHITGTNGKGSVVAMTREMLMGQGLTVGSFTSPYITRFNERIAIDGQPISDEALVKYTQRVAQVVVDLDAELPEGGPTEFEINTAIMFCYFADQPVDVVILEVGIGGLYDSTNIIEAPLVSAIVTVGYDHMKYLGNTLAEIAQQKAGIIKKNCPVVTGPLEKSAQEEIAAVAEEQHSYWYAWQRDYEAHQIGHQLLYPLISYSGGNLHRERFQLSLAGNYQVENAGVALTIVQVAMRQLNLPLLIGTLRQSLQHTNWPGRMELVNEEPLVILDGAHNLPGVQALVKTCRDDFADREIYLLVAILADKQYDLMLGELASLPNVHITVTAFNGPYSGRSSANLNSIINDIPSHHPIQVDENWQRALAKISGEVSADDVILITGSLYFISDVRHLMLD